jgi:ribonuclease J
MIKERVSFCALGGIGEIGLNCYLYSIFNNDNNESSNILVDLGMGFNDTKTISVDTFFPDLSILKEQNINIDALVITHGHEDHIGAIPYLWEMLGCPIYATPWTADLILEKLKEFKLDTKVKMVVVERDKFYTIGKYQIKWVEVLHSIPDCSLLYIKTPKGNIVHSGDFKVDPKKPEMIEKWKDIGNEGIDYLFCDSTNVLEPGFSVKEEDLVDDLSKIIKNAKGVCWITSFSSNLSRLNTICNIAKEYDKKVVLFGRSLDTYARIGITHHILRNDIIIPEDQAKDIPRNKLIFMVTGSQGEYRSALSNLLIGGGFRQKLDPQDCIIFASKVIPGNELKVNKYYNILADMGMNFYTTHDYNIHASGHAKQEELKIMYKSINPKVIVPMHGEPVHLRYHVDFANKNGFDSKYLINGEVMELFTEENTVIGNLEVGKLTYESGRVLNAHEDFLNKRTKIFYEGTVFISLLLEKKQIKNIEISIIGLLTIAEEEIYKKQIVDKITDYLLPTLQSENKEKEKISEEIRVLVRKYFRNKLDKKPIVSVHVV